MESCWQALTGMDGSGLACLSGVCRGRAGQRTRSPQLRLRGPSDCSELQQLRAEASTPSASSRISSRCPSHCRLARLACSNPRPLVYAYCGARSSLSVVAKRPPQRRRRERQRLLPLLALRGTLVVDPRSLDPSSSPAAHAPALRTSTPDCAFPKRCCCPLARTHSATIPLSGSTELAGTAPLGTSVCW